MSEVPERPRGGAAGLIVAGSSFIFAGGAFVLTYAAAAQRYDAGAAAVEPSRQALEAYLAHDPQPHLWGDSSLPVNQVKAPGTQLWAMLEHVLVLTSIVAAALAVLAVLVVHGRTLLAMVGGVALAGSAAFAGGPLSPLVPQIAQAVPDSYRATSSFPGGAAEEAGQSGRWLAYVDAGSYFEAPLWWRLAVAGGVLGLILVVVAVLRRAAGRPRTFAPVDGVALGAGYALAAGALILVVSPPLVDGGGAGLVSASTLVTSLVLGIVAFHAGTTLPGRHSLWFATALTSGLGLAAGWLWWAMHVDGGSPQAFGYGDSGASAPPVGNLACAALVVVALPLGFAVSSALAAHRGPARGVVLGRPPSCPCET